MASGRIEGHTWQEETRHKRRENRNFSSERQQRPGFQLLRGQLPVVVPGENVFRTCAEQENRQEKGRTGAILGGFQDFSGLKGRLLKKKKKEGIEGKTGGKEGRCSIARVFQKLRIEALGFRSTSLCGIVFGQMRCGHKRKPSAC